MISTDACRIIDLKHFGDRRGLLTPVDHDDLPFEVKRLFYLYDIPGGADRGGHAHKKCHQLIVSVLGSFEVKVTDGIHEKSFVMARAFSGLYIPPTLWSSLVDFSSGAICLVLTSDLFDEEDYIRKFEDYQRFRKIV